MICSLLECMFESYVRDPTRDETYPQGLSLVAGLEIADIGERDELGELVGRAPRHGLEHETDVARLIESSMSPAQSANLSTLSPVSLPNNRASSQCRRSRRCTARCSAFSATR